MGKSWQEKYHNGKSPQVKVIDKRFADIEAITPFWRVIDKKAPIVKKRSFDYAFIAEQRHKEGLPE